MADSLAFGENVDSYNPTSKGKDKDADGKRRDPAIAAATTRQNGNVFRSRSESVRESNDTASNIPTTTNSAAHLLGAQRPALDVRARRTPGRVLK